MVALSKESSFAFIGNRGFVLEAMFGLELNIKHIAAIKGSYLQRQLEEKQIAFELCSNKKDFLDWMGAIDFDVFVANGCPYKVPVANYDDTKQLLVNIHPSYLPDLRGVDPVPGALLMGRDSGATCHMMDDGFDTGDIISQVRIPYSKELDAPLLYQLSFNAEVEAFKQAYEASFEVSHAQKTLNNDCYYSKQDSDLLLDFTKDATSLYRQVRAFNNQTQLTRFHHNNSIIKVTNAEIIRNEFMDASYKRCANNEVVLLCEQSVIVKKEAEFLRLYVESAGHGIVIGDIITG